MASAVVAISYDGNRRAFWVGFFLTVLVTTLDGRSSFIGTAFAFPWAQRLLNTYGIHQNALTSGGLNPTYFFMLSTIHAVMVLLIATVMGILGVLISGGNRQANNRQAKQ